MCKVRKRDKATGNVCTVHILREQDTAKIKAEPVQGDNNRLAPNSEAVRTYGHTQLQSERFLSRNMAAMVMIVQKGK
jgi:hypothetical protein